MIANGLEVRHGMMLRIGRFAPRFALFAASFLAAMLPLSARATTVGPLTELTATAAGIGQRAPAVAWDGTRYVIVWEDSRNTATGVDLYLARIDDDGALLDANGIALLEPSARAGNQTQPQITYNAAGLTFLIVWTDPRNASADIYAARFIPGTATVVEQGGLQISSEGDADGAPAVACAVQSCLVAWNASIGGGTRVRAKRIYPDGAPLDVNSIAFSSGGATNELKPRVAAFGSDFVLTWEDDRNTLTTGLDLFARRMPDLGAVMAVSGTVISSSMFRQTEADVATVGTGLVITWQDQRLGPGVDENTWRNVFDSTLSVVGAGEAALSSAPNDQQRPRVAGDSSRGLAIWQDRRSGAYGFTYGTRLDAQGAIRDPNGFPLIVRNQNVFEHAIVKGPGADYLVAAVEFHNTAPRIFYRIVRDEAPDGMMNVNGTLQVPADGVTPAIVTFTGARGASGFAVADGTLYTINLSSTTVRLGEVTIDPPDADPNRAGHQIVAIDGEVELNLISRSHGALTVDASSVEGTSLGSANVTFNNVPPVVTSAVVAPSNPTSREDLTLTYQYSDLNGDLENGTSIEWTRNLGVEGAYANQTRVPASATRRGDAWRARITPRDGFGSGQFVFSNQVTIGNTPPQVLNVRIDPQTGVRHGTMLRGRYAFDDIDSDPESEMTQLRWFDRGMEVLALAGQTEVPGSMVVKGQEWTFSVEPHDGYDAGPVVVSAPVSVGNTAPVADAGQNGAVVERRSTALDGTTSADADPADRLRFAWRQTQGVIVVLSSSTSATPSFTAPSVRGTTILQFELIVSDGEASSPPDLVVVEITPVADTDGDGLDDEQEAEANTNPMLADSDRDGLGDLEEVEGGIDPLDEDADDDGIRDGAEGARCPETCAVDPLGDADGDSIPNAADEDSDGDGILDGTEFGVRTALAGTDPTAMHFKADADPNTRTDPTSPDTDLDRAPDGVEDANKDGKLDPGETDPNDPTDPPTACTPSGNECPPMTVCAGGTCDFAANVDGGLMCRPLAEQDLECCSGGCSGTAAQPICIVSGAVEQCPIGAQQCPIGSCSGATPMKRGDDGCSCTASREDTSSPLAMLVLAAITWGRRRRSS